MSCGGALVSVATTGVLDGDVAGCVVTHTCTGAVRLWAHVFLRGGACVYICLVCLLHACCGAKRLNAGCWLCCVMLRSWC